MYTNLKKEHNLYKLQILNFFDKKKLNNGFILYP